jgi:hypothetical protein
MQCPSCLLIIALYQNYAGEVVPMIWSKWWWASWNMSSCDVTTPWSDCREWIKFLRCLEFAFLWKNLVFAFPDFNHVTRLRCHRLISGSTDNPNILAFRLERSATSYVDNFRSHSPYPTASVCPRCGSCSTALEHV